MYAKVKMDAIVQFPYSMDDLQAENPYTNFDAQKSIEELYAVTEDAINTGCTIVFVSIEDNMHSFDPLKKAVRDDLPTLIESNWIWKWHYENKTEQEIEEYSPTVASDSLMKANNALETTAWTQEPDSGLTPDKIEEWRIYREELSNISSQPGFPLAFVWPKVPT